MQIYLKWTCRKCGLDQELRTDTADYGVLETDLDLDFDTAGTVNVGLEHLTGSSREILMVSPAYRVELPCSQCGHVSGELGLGYRYKAEHQPNSERNSEASS